MTVNKTLEAIEVMRAFVEGRQIQVRSRNNATNIIGTASEGTQSPAWANIQGFWGYTPSWDWEHCEYRVYQD